LAVELSKRGDFVFATARGDPTPALQELVSNSSGRVEYLKLDVTNRSNAEEAAKHVEASGKSIDVLINNAGVINETSNRLDAMNDLDSTFNSNVTSAHIVTSAFLSLLRKGTQKKVVNISTAAGSIAMASKYSTVAPPAYKVSKAALNMLTAQYAQSYEKEGFTFIAVSPGRLRTDMGGESGDLDVETGQRLCSKWSIAMEKSLTANFSTFVCPAGNRLRAESNMIAKLFLGNAKKHSSFCR